MKSNNPEPLSVFVGKGRVTTASYHEQEIAAYQFNPFIEALPPILSEDDALEALARYPPYDENERFLLPHLRLHCIQGALQFFAPLPIHLDLERRFSRLIRAGYLARNPLAKGFWENVNGRVQSLGSSTARVGNCARSIPLGFTIIGFPGVGKTTSVESVLSLYPQVIYHSRYRGRDFTQTQIVWLKLDCPFDGSIKGICLNFFQAIDDLIGTTYHAKFGSKRLTVDELLPHMARVAAIHGLGVLAIDEIQHLSSAKSGGASKMLNFFVQLANTIGVPIVLIGTYKAQSVLSGEFRQIRRGTGQGDLVWDRMQEGAWVEKDDETLTPGIWQLFLESLWFYQYVRTPCPLTKELSHVLYQETQGITDFATKIFMLAQIRAITTDTGNSEFITKSIIRSVARDSLRQAQPVLAALRKNKMGALSKVEDIHPIQVDGYIQKAYDELVKTTKISTTNDNSKSETSEHNQSKEPTSLSTDEKIRKLRRQRTAVQVEGDLRGSMEKSIEQGSSVYETLRQAGHIQSPSNTNEGEVST
jgi:hypothetical protein